VKEVPELWELTGLFEIGPTYVYGKEKEIPWFYSTVNFRLKRGSETLDIIISPAYGIIAFSVFTGDREIMQVNLENVEGMKIEKLHNKETLHIIFNDNDMIKEFFIETKPQIFVYCNKPQYL